jgi:methyl-accepting chemotaxis protein
MIDADVIQEDVEKFLATMHEIVEEAKQFNETMKQISQHLSNVSELLLRAKE